MFWSFLQTEMYSLITIGLCLVAAAFLSAAETAITGLGTLKAKQLLETGGKSYRYFQLWVSNPSRVITTILICNNIVNILASVVTTHLADSYFESKSIGVATFLITVLVLVFAEIVPKSFAKAHSEVLAVWSMPIVYGIYIMAWPIVMGFSRLAEIAIWIGSRGRKGEPLITEEDIEYMFNEGQKAGVLGDIKKDIIEGAFDFDETKVREIMTPRTDLTAVDVDAPIDEILAAAVKTGHSRIPVYREDIDHVVGLILAKDLLNYIKQPEKLQTLTAKDFMRDAFFTPESKSIMEVFKELKRTKSHLAVIIDEYGGTAGIVTMEDILEEIVGEIQDETDTEEAKILKIGENTYEVSGSVNVEEFIEYFALSEDVLGEDGKDLNVDTLSGLITHLVGQMPKPGQKVSIGSLKLEVTEVFNRRINTVKVVVEPANEIVIHQ